MTLKSPTASQKEFKLECGPTPDVMAGLPNAGGALCSTPQSLADAHYQSAVQLRCQEAKPVEICWGAPNSLTELSRQWAKFPHIVGTCGGDIAV